MKLERRTQADRTAATRAALTDAGRALFAEHGFAGVGAETIVQQASVSRGALYHHFGDKTELFAAVVADVEREVAQQLADIVATDDSGSFVEAMMRCVDAWLDASQRPEVHRIVLVDGPSVLGWQRWRGICQDHVLGLIESVLAQGAHQGTLLSLPARPLAHLLLAMADEAALYATTADDRQLARSEMMTIVRPLLESLTAAPGN